MKKGLLLVSFLAPALAHAQSCTKPFISEYVEGWSNNKALEIYNPTANAIDLTNYGLVRFANGSTSFGSISYLSDMIVGPYDVLVIVLDKQDPNGVDLEAPVWDELMVAADAFINPLYDNGIWPMYFNGNDAVALLTDDGETLIDLFGRIGEGSDFLGWGPYTDSGGDPAYISQDHSLIRKENVMNGVEVNPSSFDIEAEWDSLPANTFENLGQHSCLCNPDHVLPVVKQESNVRIYPNPVSGSSISILADQEIMEVRLLDLGGKVVQRTANCQDWMLQLSLSPQVDSGVFVLEIYLADGTVYRQRLIH